MNCPLCKNHSKIFYSDKKRLYNICNNCDGIFMDKKYILSTNDEKLRYENHNNDVEDIGYQKFVSPITNSILNNHNINQVGLDFGAGKGPVISKILKDNDFNVKLYDPYFHNYPKLLDDKYDYIILCEVMEHFNNPDKEFKLLKSLLKANGKLYCMTSLYNKDIDFKNWYYKNDSTHIFIYQEKTILWIKENFKFVDVIIDGNLIIFN